jgi:hypothetical protein
MHYSIGPESATDLNNFGKHHDWVNKRRDGDLCTHENLQKRLTECGDVAFSKIRYQVFGSLETRKLPQMHACNNIK